MMNVSFSAACIMRKDRDTRAFHLPDAASDPFAVALLSFRDNRRRKTRLSALTGQ